MKNRAIFQVSAALVVVVLLAFYFHAGVMQSTVALGSNGHDDDRYSRMSGDLAPIRILRYEGLRLAHDWVRETPGKIVLTDSELLVAGHPVPLALLRDYLDAMVRQGTLNFVVIMATKEDSADRVLSVVGECQKSKVRVVYVAYIDG